MGTKELINEAYGLAKKKGWNQWKWSMRAGRSGSGQTVSRILTKGDCRMSTMQDLLKPLGYELSLKKTEVKNEGS